MLARAEGPNFADRVLRHARTHPGRLALVVPRGDGEDGVTYAELARRVAGFSAGLRAAGLRPGERVALLCPVSVDFYALALAVMAAGLAVVLLDGRMGLKRGLRALAAAQPRAVVSIRALLRLWPLLPPMWRARRYCADARVAGTRALSTLLLDGHLELQDVTADTSALVTFTSGTTGRPKGANRTHGLLTAQHLALREEFPEAGDEVDMPCFPAVALHNLCCGVTTVLPPVDLRAPASVDPARVWAFAARHGVTSLSGAPAYSTRLIEHLEATQARVPGLRRFGVGGAPVSRRLCRRVAAALPGVDARIIYGSTEAEPIASLSMTEAAEASDARGFALGRPAPAAEVALLAPDQAPPVLDARGVAPYRVAPGAPGELVVRGAHVNRGYVGDPGAERANKLRDPDGSVWHRTGDLTYADPAGRLWLLGRAPDVLPGGLYPGPVEAAVLDLPGVAAAALVAHRRAPAGELAVVLEPGAPAATPAAIARLLAAHAPASIEVRTLAELPVDARHQSRVDRPALRARLER